MTEPDRHDPVCGWGYWGSPDQFCDYPPGHPGPHSSQLPANQKDKKNA